MQTSEAINELATALAKAQGQITGALKDSANPFFKSKYADLASCWDACRKSLSDNGLSVVQITGRGKPVTVEWETKNEKTAEVTSFRVDTEELLVITTLMHSSGQWIRSELPMIPREASPQGIGSALTYGRRYGLTAMVGVAQMDDDGNAASGKGTNGAAHQEAVREVHGDLGRNITEDAAMTEATARRGILELDIEDRIKMLKVLDRHDVLNKDQDLYAASSRQMSSKERSAWNKFVAAAKEAQKEDSASDPTRRRSAF